MKGSGSGNQLIPDLRRALQHLYDHVALHRSSLVECLRLGHQKDPALALRRLLTEAIDSLRPDPTVPPQSHAWRTYQILSQRYLEQLTQKEVAVDLGLGVRQLQRQERRALRVLADYLYARYELNLSPATPTIQGDMVVADQVPSRALELARLSRSLPSEPVNLGLLIQGALGVVGPMAESLAVRIGYTLPEGLPCLAAQQMTIRQALLILLTAAIRSVPGGRVCVRVEDERWGESIIICALRGSAISALLGKEHLVTLDVARELVSLSNGSLVVTADDMAEKPFTARLTLPVFEQVPVLVVDDNEDALQLYQHYLAGSRYQFIGACDPQELLTTIERRDPQIIVLDVMLPGIDGWELLGRLRAHPKTSHVPVIVCTILPQQQLASSLGAAGFLSKPVTRQELLAALDQQLALLSKRCR